MTTGIEFLTSELREAAATHASLLESMTYHESEANDSRYRDLCDRHLPRIREHQLMLEELLVGLGAKASFGKVRFAPSLADTPVSDYHLLVSDLNLARRLEVTFKTFRDAGRALHLTQLAKLGETAERHHDEYSADAKRLLLQMFVERAHEATDSTRVADDRSRVDTRIR